MPFGFRVLRPRANQIRKMSPTPANYDGWSREELVARLVQLDRPKTHHPHIPSAPFQISKYPRRKIAIKFSYSGWEYNGLAFQNTPTPLPTVEEVLFDAFARTRLVDRAGGYEGCGWERCGRTDRGVSAAGQVVSLWVRSAPGGDDEAEPNIKADPMNARPIDRMGDSEELNSDAILPVPFSKPKSELFYLAILNRVL